MASFLSFLLVSVALATVSAAGCIKDATGTYKLGDQGLKFSYGESAIPLLKACKLIVIYLIVLFSLQALERTARIVRIIQIVNTRVRLLVAVITTSHSSVHAGVVTILTALRIDVKVRKSVWFS